MPYDSVCSGARAPCALHGANFIATPAMVGLYGCAGLALLCIFWRLDRALWYRSANFWAISYCRPHSHAMAVSFFWGLASGARCAEPPVKRRGAHTVGGAFIVTLAAMWISPRRIGGRDSRFTLCRAEPYSGRCFPSLRSCWRLSSWHFAGPHLSRDVCRAAGPVAPPNGTFVYSMVHDELEKVRHCARLDGATTLNICGSPFCRIFTAGLVTEITGRCRWRFWTSPRWDF